MISKIQANNIDRRQYQSQPQSQPQFKGGLADGVFAAIQACEQYPMLNVTVLDLGTAILPRTYFEGKTNAYAGLEAFRRESSGLIVNCLIPGVIVLGIAKAIAGFIMGGKTNMGSNWANEDAIKLVSSHWKATESFADEKTRVSTTIKNIINGMSGKDGDKAVKFEKVLESDINGIVENLTKTVMDPSAKTKAEVDAAYKAIVKKTLVAEHVTVAAGKDLAGHNGSLKSIIRDTTNVLKEFVDNKITTVKNVDDFTGKAKKLINSKSILGLGAVLGLAVSMQSINRWITTKTSGKKGAPIYKDFEDSKTKELTGKQKSELFSQKIISIGAMVGVALLSVMKKPNWKLLKDTVQFKGILPSMDQARLISAATFASRMGAAEDKNELREATVRDIATFSAFYFLGDYVAKGIATMMPSHNLINYLDSYKSDAKGLGKVWQWAKNTSLKSTDEIATAGAKKMRSLCQLGNIGFSLLALGAFIPIITRKRTDKQREKELKEQGMAQALISKYYPTNFAMNSARDTSKGNVYQAFFTSK